MAKHEQHNKYNELDTVKHELATVLNVDISEVDQNLTDNGILTGDENADEKLSLYKQAIELYQESNNQSESNNGHNAINDLLNAGDIKLEGYVPEKTVFNFRRVNTGKKDEKGENIYEEAKPAIELQVQYPTLSQLLIEINEGDEVNKKRAQDWLLDLVKDEIYTSVKKSVIEKGHAYLPAEHTVTKLFSVTRQAGRKAEIDKETWEAFNSFIKQTLSTIVEPKNLANLIDIIKIKFTSIRNLPDSLRKVQGRLQQFLEIVGENPQLSEEFTNKFIPAYEYANRKLEEYIALDPAIKYDPSQL